jgi:hypothetical protein
MRKGKGNTTSISDRGLGASASKIHGVLLPEILRERAAAHGNTTLIMETGITTLQKQGQITGDEATKLRQIVSAVVTNSTGSSSTINSIYQQLLRQNASPSALVIAGVAANSTIPLPSPTPGHAPADPISLRDILGAIGGSALAGPWGGLAGGLIASAG